MLRERLNYSHITLLSDEENALYGALGTKPGIVVLSGTGSFAVGRSGQGEKVVCGGWGPLIGDLGSGYHIGIMALSTIARRFDQGKDGGLLSNAVLDRLGLQEVRLLKRALYQPGLSRAQIASLSFTVEEVARKGNADALAIIDTAARDLAELASDVALRMAEESPCVALVGGISRMKDIIVRPFWNYIQEMIPHATRIDGEFPPSVGAMLYVLDTYEHIDICEMEKLLQEKGRLRTTC
jgi:N-acetylglucosamine kinase-like BadF-type ATPase